MIATSVLGSAASSPSGARMFRYEVKGLRQSIDNDRNEYPFRSSDSVFITVPYSRMNEEMRRITRMGGTIVSIKPMVAAQEEQHQQQDRHD